MYEKWGLACHPLHTMKVNKASHLTNFHIETLIETIFAPLMCRTTSKGCDINSQSFDPKRVVWCLKMTSKVFKPQITKLGHAPKMGPTS